MLPTHTFRSDPFVIQCATPSAEGLDLDQQLSDLRTGPGVFAVWPVTGEPYLGRAGNLRRRLSRLLRVRQEPGRMLNVRSVASRVEYWPTASGLESSLILYELARVHLPERYLELLRLRMPSYVRLTLSNAFPRTQVTSRVGAGGISYGPFRTRASAEQFERQLLDLFQIRRCHKDLEPAQDHPGCVYGEMNMCIRPCQEIVTSHEYASEVTRVAQFLQTDGRVALHNAESARDRLSAELDFEGAARQHKRGEKIQEMLKARDELARDTASLSGVAILAGLERDSVLLWFMLAGTWQQPVRFAVQAAQTVSMDRRLKELAAGITPVQATSREIAEHLAILARWFYSSWRDGFWIGFDSLDKIPFRRVVTAVSKTLQQAAVHQSGSAASD